MSTDTGVEEKTQMRGESKEKKEEGKTPKGLSPKLQKIIQAVEELTVMELANLVKALEEKFGVSAQAPVAVAASGGAATAGAAIGPAAETEEKTSFQVILTNAGDKKIQVIKEIRAVTTLGLKEAKELVESAPKPIKDNATKEEAEKIKATLETAGAKVEIK